MLNSRSSSIPTMRDRVKGGRGGVEKLFTFLVVQVEEDANNCKLAIITFMDKVNLHGKGLIPEPMLTGCVEMELQ